MWVQMPEIQWGCSYFTASILLKNRKERILRKKKEREREKRERKQEEEREWGKQLERNVLVTVITYYHLAHTWLNLAFCVMYCCFSCVELFVTPWLIAYQNPQSIAFSRQEYWSGLLCPPPGDLPDPGTEPTSLTHVCCIGRQADSSPIVLPVKPKLSIYQVKFYFHCF